MRKYLAIFKMNFVSQLQYRSAAIAGSITQICFGLMYVFLFGAFYKYGNIPADFSYSQMVSYLWLQQAFFAFFYLFEQDKEIISAIVEGNIGYELARPMNLYNKWAATIYSKKLSKSFMRMVPLFVVAIALPASIGIGLPASWGAFGMFLLSLVTGGVLVTAICMLAHILVFKSMNPNGIFSFFATIGGFCSGVLCPIPLMPDILQKILKFTPFNYLNDFSFRIYVGSYDIKTSLINMGIQIAWIIGIWALGYFLLQRSLKKVEVQGG